MQNVRSTNDDNTTNDIRPVAFLRPDRITVKLKPDTRSTSETRETAWRGGRRGERQALCQGSGVTRISHVD